MQTPHVSNRPIVIPGFSNSPIQSGEAFELENYLICLSLLIFLEIE
jgi:hypothetical protein